MTDLSPGLIQTDGAVGWRCSHFPQCCLVSGELVRMSCPHVCESQRNKRAETTGNIRSKFFSHSEQIKTEKGKQVLREGLTSVHCPLVWTMSMTQGSDLFSVSRSSRALHDTRSSTLETQAAGPLRLVAGEMASWMSFILARAEGSVPIGRNGEGCERSQQGRGALTGLGLEQMSQREQRCPLSPK